MALLILVLLILAAATGVFWTVLRVTAIAVLATILTILVLTWIAVWYVRHRFRRFVRDFDRTRQPPHGPRRRDAFPTEGRKHRDEGLPS